MHSGEKTHFVVLVGKCFLAGKHILWFWRENAFFFCFSRKNVFWGSGVKTHICDFGMIFAIFFEKYVFAILVGKHVFAILFGNAFLRFEKFIRMSCTFSV